MTLSLYAATVPSNLQILGALVRLIEKAEAHCVEQGRPPASLIDARLAPDMWSFADQVRSVVVHSQGAIEGVRRGQFSPDRSAAPTTFPALRERVEGAVTMLEAVQPAEMDGWTGRDMFFVFGERRLPFTAEDFLLSFSQPNFYFHAATAYDILRAQGLPLEKRDFLGRLRLKA
jgi:uncharacterized protein